MSLDTNYKILAGSVIKLTDKRILLGNNVNSDPLILYDLLLKNLEYATKLYTTLEDPEKKTLYKLKIKVLTHGIDVLRHQCPDICNYKDSYILTRANNPPTIEDHSFDLPLSVLAKIIPQDNFIHNFKDIDNDVLAKFVFTELPENMRMYVDLQPAKENVEYSNKAVISANYGLVEGGRFFVENTYEQNPDGTSACTPKVRTLNKEEVFNTEGAEGYREIFNEGKFVGIKDGNAVFQRTFSKNQGEKSLVFQTFENVTNEIPDDTIIYIHMDITMSPQDKKSLNSIILFWWDKFQRENPNFAGSLLVNTLSNSELKGGARPSYYVNEYTPLDYQNIKGPDDIQLYPSWDSTERWLANPMLGILRQKYKEDPISRFSSLDELTEYIRGKSLVMLSFMDETDRAYYDERYTDMVVSDKFVQDYKAFLYLRSHLSFFKGVVYAITQVDESKTISSFVSTVRFLIHAIAAIQRKYDSDGNPVSTFSNDEIDAMVSSVKKEKINTGLSHDRLGRPKVGDVVSYEDIMHNKINQNNPYERYNRLAELGWEGRWDKYSPLGEIMSAASFGDDLNGILTDIGEQEITTIKEVGIPFEKVESPIESIVKIKAKDSSSYNPLYSNEATITVNHVAECITNIPDPHAEEVARTINHKSSYTFRPNDFTFAVSDELLFKITGVEMAITGGDNQEVNQDQDLGHLQYHAHKFSSVEDREIVMTFLDLASEHFAYVSNPDIQETVTVTVKYKISYIGAYNYSEKEGTIVITKNPNTLTAPTFALTENLIVPQKDRGNVVIPILSLIYNGRHDNLRYYWEELEKPERSQASIVSSYSRDVEILNLKDISGQYKYKITVTATDEPFEVEKEVTIIVSEPTNPYTLADET